MISLRLILLHADTFFYQIVFSYLLTFRNQKVCHVLVQFYRLLPQLRDLILGNNNRWQGE